MSILHQQLPYYRETGGWTIISWCGSLCFVFLYQQMSSNLVCLRSSFFFIILILVLSGLVTAIAFFNVWLVIIITPCLLVLFICWTLLIQSAYLSCTEAWPKMFCQKLLLSSLSGISSFYSLVFCNINVHKTFSHCYQRVYLVGIVSFCHPAVLSFLLFL